LRGDISQATVFFSAGTYEFLKTQNNTTAVYVLARVPNDPVINMIFLGPYGEVALPATMPAINFPSGTDFAAAVPITITTGGGGNVIGTPEFSVLRRLPRFPEVTGRLLETKLALRHGLQYVTAWGATGVLKALQKPVTVRGLFIDWSPFTFEIEPWCAGTNLLKLMVAVGLGLAILLRPGWPRAFALVGMAGLIAVEANVFRVAATVLLYEHMGREAWAWKDWIGGAATAIALAQVIVPVAVAIGTRRSLSRF
jgi:exosortase/archaeosortase family protein